MINQRMITNQSFVVTEGRKNWQQNWLSNPVAARHKWGCQKKPIKSKAGGVPCEGPRHLSIIADRSRKWNFAFERLGRRNQHQKTKWTQRIQKTIQPGNAPKGRTIGPQFTIGRKERSSVEKNRPNSPVFYRSLPLIPTLDPKSNAKTRENNSRSNKNE